MELSSFRYGKNVYDSKLEALPLLVFRWPIMILISRSSFPNRRRTLQLGQRMDAVLLAATKGSKYCPIMLQPVIKILGNKAL